MAKKAARSTEEVHPDKPATPRRRPNRLQMDDIATPQRQTRTTRSAGKARRKSDDPSAFLQDLDSVMVGISGKVAQDTGCDDIATPEENLKSIVGIPFPSLSLCWLFGINCWVLGRIVEIFGQEGSCKSSLVFEFARMHAEHYALGAILENENKEAAVLLNSLMMNGKNRSRLRVHPTNTLEGWQKGLTFWTQRMEEVSVEKGFRFPVFLGLDSLTATNSEESLKKIDASGAATRSFPIEAQLISTYFKTLPEKLRNRPWTFMATNHLKPGTDSAGRPKDNVPGGKSMKFMASVRVKMSFLADVKTATGGGGVRVQLQLVKNSLAPGKKKLAVEMKWRIVETRPGIFEQETFWDWDQATIEMLLGIKDKAKGMWNTISKIVDIVPVSGKRCWSKALGIPKDKPVKYSIAGNMLEHREDLLEQLYPILMISRCRGYEPGSDYKKLLQELKDGPDDVIAPMPQRILVGNSVDPSLFSDATEGLAKRKERDVSNEPEDYEEEPEAVESEE